MRGMMVYVTPYWAAQPARDKKEDIYFTLLDQADLYL